MFSHVSNVNHLQVIFCKCATSNLTRCIWLLYGFFKIYLENRPPWQPNPLHALS